MVKFVIGKWLHKYLQLFVQLNLFFHCCSLTVSCLLLLAACLLRSKEEALNNVFTCSWEQREEAADSDQSPYPGFLHCCSALYILTAFVEADAQFSITIPMLITGCCCCYCCRTSQWPQLSDQLKVVLQIFFFAMKMFEWERTSSKMSCTAFLAFFSE